MMHENALAEQSTGTQRASKATSEASIYISAVVVTQLGLKTSSSGFELHGVPKSI